MPGIISIKTPRSNKAQSKWMWRDRILPLPASQFQLQKSVQFLSKGQTLADPITDRIGATLPADISVPY